MRDVPSQPVVDAEALAPTRRGQRNWGGGDLQAKGKAGKERGWRPCTVQEDRFAKLYAVSGLLIPSTLEAGYCKKKKSRASAQHVGWRLLQRVWVREKIVEYRKAAMEQLGTSEQEVLGHLVTIMRGNIMDYMVKTEDGRNFMTDVSRMTYQEAGAVKSVTVEEYTEGSGEEARQVKRTKLEMHDKGGSIEKIMKKLRMYDVLGDALAGMGQRTALPATVADTEREIAMLQAHRQSLESMVAEANRLGSAFAGGPVILEGEVVEPGTETDEHSG